MDTPEPLHLLRFGVFELDPRTGELRKAGRKVQIQEQPFRLLAALLEHPGEVVSRDDLQRKLWQSDTFGDFDTGLNKAIAKVREALADSADSPRFIETMPRRGYRFIAPVETVPLAAAPEPPASPPEPGYKTKLAGAALAAVLLLGLAAWAWQSFRPARPGFKSIAVLPLQNLSGDPAQEYFADGMTDELITDLAQIHSLKVISRTSVMQFKQTKEALPKIAGELGVDAIVEGSVLRSGASVRVTAQLLDARQDRHLWASSYERQLSDVVGLQHEVARAIADQVSAELTQQEQANLTRERPTNPEAYQAILKGRFHWNERNPASVTKAIDYFKRAVEIDPGNAEAWVGLGGCYASLGGDQGAVAPEKVLPDARAAIAKALVIDDHLADAYLQLAWIKLWYDWDWPGAESAFRRSIDLNPNDTSAHRYYSFFLTFMRRFDEALAENRRALDLSPLDTLNSMHIAWIYTAEHQPEKALEQSKRVLELDPGFMGAYLFVARAYESEGKWPEAAAAWDKTKDTYKVGYLVGMGRNWAASGHKGEAEAALRQLHELSKQSYVSPIAFAASYLALGQRRVALDWLEKAYRERSTGLAGLAIDNQFDDLRSDPSFQDLLRRIGFKVP